jgi:hypothetical protein
MSLVAVHANPVDGAIVDKWRDQPPELWNDFIAQVTESIVERLNKGRAKYGDSFVGMPLDQAWEEILDLLFYIYMEYRRKE